jgi:hypothetical protein
VVTNPTSTHNEIPNSVWSVGGIEETGENKFFLKVVPNRRVDSIVEVLGSFIHDGSILVTDGYPSYPEPQGCLILII